MPIQKQIWIDVLLENFIPEDSFLKLARDMSEYVEYNKINLAEIGADPKVLIDNDSFPVEAVERSDKGIEVVLHTFDTQNTIVRNLEKKELAYKKMDSVVSGHRRALLREMASFALHAFAPQSHTSQSPVFGATSEAKDGNRRRLCYADILKMDAHFRRYDIDPKDVVCCLCPEHLNDLMLEDLKQYNQVISTGRLFSFNLHTSSLTPMYKSGAKQVRGIKTGDASSIFWSKDDVAFARGSADVFAEYNSPKERADIIGFQQRFTAMPLRAYTAAIYSPSV